MVLALVCSIVIGLLLGLLGGGGSLLTVPMLVYLLGVEPKAAIAASFVVVSASSLLALVPHALARNVCWKSGALFGLTGMAGAFAGGRFASFFPADGLMVLFGLIALWSGLAMLSAREASGGAPVDGLDGACPARVPVFKVLYDGLFVGVLTGLLGVGGGFLILPALVGFVGLSMAGAVGTSLLIIAMNAAAGLWGYAGHVHVDAMLVTWVTGGAVLGSLAGGWLSLRVGTMRLKRLFGCLVAAVGSFILWRHATPSLLHEVNALFAAHREFVLGLAAAGIVFVLMRLGAWIHRDAD